MTDTSTTPKSVFGVLTGFLGHHVGDLEAIGSALTSVVSALPINAETRTSITSMIARIDTSAQNVAAAVADFGSNPAAAPEPVTIRESDVETALRNVVRSGALDDAIKSAVDAYAATHTSAALGGGAVATDPVKAPETATGGAGPVVGAEGV